MGQSDKHFLRTVFTRKAPLPVRIVRGISLAGALAVGLALYGDRLIPGRPLTDAEQSLYGDFFGKSVDLSAVRLHHSKLSATFMDMVGSSARTIGTRIIVDRSFYDGIDTEEEIYVLAHELAHVYQGRQNPLGTFALLARNVKNIIRNGEISYLYELKPGLLWNDYNTEQQAVMISDLFSIQRGVPRCGLLLDKHRMSDAEIENGLKAVLMDFLRDRQNGIGSFTSFPAQPDSRP